MTFEQWAQSRLTAHGFPCGPIDGVIGSGTRAALRAFQATRAIPITGAADDATVAALRAPSSRLPGNEARPTGDPQQAQPAPGHPVWPTQAEVANFYGEVGASQSSLVLPFPMRLAWAKESTVTKITLHRLVVESAGRAFEAIASAYAEEQRVDLGLDLFGGSLNVRRMRGGSAFSMHSWGIAIDFDPERNQLKWKRTASSYVVTGDDGRKRTIQTPPARLAQPDAEAFWAAWRAEGWISLGEARNIDWMHVQAARL